MCTITTHSHHQDLDAGLNFEVTDKRPSGLLLLLLLLQIHSYLLYLLYILYSSAQCLVDGRDMFDSVFEALQSAQKQVFITGWWVCPELMIQRPSQVGQEHGQW